MDNFLVTSKNFWGAWWTGQKLPLFLNKSTYLACATFWPTSLFTSGLEQKQAISVRLTISVWV